jgi:hypothetical protein
VVNGIRLSANSLMQRYGLPEKLARAVERLNAARVDVTEDVLRSAASDAALAGLLASPKLKTAAKSLTTEKLERLREKLGLGGLAAELAVVPKRTWRTIEFEHETGALPALAPLTALPIKPSDIETLFSPEEVKRLKLVVLTSAEPKERITGIRRLVLAPGPAREKGAVLLAALSDDDLQVRLEAIKALVPLGLNPDIAREAKQLVTGTPKLQTAAAVQIGRLAAEAGSGEISVLLTLVAGTLKSDIPDETRRALIHSLTPAAPVAAKDAAQLAATVTLLAEQLTERPVELSRPVRDVLTALGEADSAATVATLETEIERVSDAETRRLLLGAFSALDVPPDRRGPLAEQMTKELLTAPEPETSCLGIANALCRWGTPAIEALMARLDDALRQQKNFMLRALDGIASNRACPAGQKAEVAAKLLRLLKTDTPTTRAVLLECEIFADAALPDDLKSRIAAELIQHVHEFGGPRMIGVIEDTIAKLGEPAIAPLLELLTGGVRDRERESAARVLGAIVARLHGAGKRVSELAVSTLMVCVRQLDKGFPDRDELAASIGRMCTSKAMPADTVRRVADGLRVRVGKEPYSFGLLEGLGRLAASPNVKLNTRVEVAESLLRLLEVDLPEMQSRRFTGGEKTIFIAGNEAAAYTDMIPILLDGLCNVCVHAGSSALRGRLVEALIAKWHEASSWRLVWGPANTLKLAEVLGKIAVAPDAGAEIRCEIAEALAGSSDLVPVLRVLGRVLAKDSGSGAMGEVAVRVGEHVLDRLGRRSEDRIELNEHVTRALAGIAARKSLGGGDKDRTDRLRQGVAVVLYKALRNGAPGAYEALELMARSSAIRGELRSEIESRIAQD